MGKPYEHEYHFAGGGSSTGRMVCKGCNQPIFNHAHDWLSQKRSKNYDWGYETFHRKCCQNQSGWEKIERRHALGQSRWDAISKEFADLVKKYKMTPCEIETLAGGNDE